MINKLVNKHPEIVLKMLDRQKEQGNKRSWKVFKEILIISTSKRGFNWSKTEEGYCFWKRVLVLHQYDEFYKRYPSKELKYLPENYVPSGELKDIPIVIIDELMKQALLQDSPSIIEEFESKRTLGLVNSYNNLVKGMIWRKSKQGQDFWKNILVNKNIEEYIKIFPFKAYIVENGKNVLVLCKGINSNGKYIYKKKKDKNLYSTGEIFLNRPINSYQCFTKEDFKGLKGRFIKDKYTGKVHKLTGLAEDINKGVAFILDSCQIIYNSDLLQDYTFTDDSPCGKISS